MNNYDNVPSVSPESSGSLPFNMGIPSLDQSLFSNGKLKGKKSKHRKKKQLQKKLEFAQKQLMYQTYTLGQLKHENDMLRRMCDLAVAANRKQLDTNMIETSFKVIHK